MCHADLGIMTQRWVDGEFPAFPSRLGKKPCSFIKTKTKKTLFSLLLGFYEPWLVYHSEHHQCKNWAKIREWAEEHSAAKHKLPLHPNEDQRKSDALNEPWFDPWNMTYIDGLCGNGYC